MFPYRFRSQEADRDEADQKDGYWRVTLS